MTTPIDMSKLKTKEDYKAMVDKDEAMIELLVEIRDFVDKDHRERK